jgi:hypothetical protein
MNYPGNLSFWRLKMTHPSADSIKSYVAIAAFFFQGLGSIYYFAQQNQKTLDQLELVRAQLSELKSSQALLAQVVVDVAVLKAQQVNNAQAIVELQQRQGLQHGR